MSSIKKSLSSPELTGCYVNAGRNY